MTLVNLTINLGLLVVVCLAVQAEDKYSWQWTYGMDSNVTYHCSLTEDEAVHSDACSLSMESSPVETLGCCVHLDSNDTVRLTCPLKRRECPQDASYITGEKVYRIDWVNTTRAMDVNITTESYWNLNDSSTFPIDPWPGLASGEIVGIIGGCIAGVLLLITVTICCCKWTTCCRKRHDDDSISLVSQDDPFIYPAGHRTRATRQGGDNQGYIDVRRIEDSSRPPTYAQSMKEDQKPVMWP